MLALRFVAAMSSRIVSNPATYSAIVKWVQVPEGKHGCYARRLRKHALLARHAHLMMRLVLLNVLHYHYVPNITSINSQNICRAITKLHNCHVGNIRLDPGLKCV